jgi:biopolymer transport protein ExbB/TolQ
VNQLARLAGAGRLSFEGGRGIVGAVAAAAQTEWAEGSARQESRAELRARIERAMRASMKSELRRIESGLSFLATVGSAAPFVGLLGTVWGIMNSFTAIAQAKDTSLAVVAPGIAEALFATALGLAAAIPAVVAYNQISVSLGRSAERAGTSIAALARAVARGQGDGTVRLEGVG